MQNGAPLYPKNMCLLYGRNFSTEMNIFFSEKKWAHYWNNSDGVI